MKRTTTFCTLAAPVLAAAGLLVAAPAGSATPPGGSATVAAPTGSATAVVPPAGSATAMAPPVTQEPEDALLGFDPVALIRTGEERFGEEELAVVHDGYRYLFVDEANRDTFLEDPARWGIQLGGLCARMGGTTGGDPELYTVHEGRIYIFGAPDCLTLFEETPSRYLPPPAAPSLAETSSAEARRQGADLLVRAVAAHGGAAAVDGVERYAESGTVVDLPDRRPALAWKVAWPERFRRERELSMGTLADVTTPDGSFYALPDGRTQPQRAAEGRGLARIFQRHPLWILKARNRPDFVAAAADGGEALEVEFDGLRMTVGLDAEGRIARVAWQGRGPGGAQGSVEETWSDHRPVDGVVLPHRRARTFDGEPWPGSTVEVAEIVINGTFPDGLFRR